MMAFYLLRTRFNLLEIYSVSGVMVLYFFCILRTILPFELPYTRVIQGGTIYNKFYTLMNDPLWHILGGSIAVKHILLLIWGIGSLILLLKNIAQHRKVYHFLEALPEERDPLVAEVKREVIDNALADRVKIVRFPDIETPYCAGIRKRYIILPQKEYTRQQLHYILMHESTHIKNQDAKIKNLIMVFCMIYWWNPCAYLLKKDFFQSIEIRCDGMVVEGISNQEKGEYLSTILNEFKQAVQSGRYSDIFIPLGENTEENVLERFQLVENGKNRKQFRGKLFAWFLGAVLLLASYTVVIQSAFDAPIGEIEVEDMSEVDSQNTYILKCRDGTYQLVTPDGQMEIDETAVKNLVRDGFPIWDEKAK